MVNYVFYSSYLFILLIINLTHVYMLSPSFFFMVEAFLQSLFEVAVIAYIGSFVKSRAVGITYIGAIFLLLMIHVVDFILARVMSMNFWFTLDLILEESFDNFIEMLLLTGVSPITWGFIFVGGFMSLVILTRVFYRMNLYAGRFVQRGLFLPFLSIIPLCSLTFGLWQAPSAYEYQKGVGSLPFKCTLVAHTLPQIKQPKVLAVASPSRETSVVLGSRPNIYLIISESLRSDYLTKATAPHLVEFREANIHVSHTFSNANATPNSWFSIFHSKLPFHWQSTERGSVPLSLLKKMGYKIRVYSAAQLKYYHMDQNIFGESLSLMDHFEHFPHYPPDEAWASDTKALEHMMRDLETHQESTLFVLFLDGTHFEYSWPSDFATPFMPIDKERSHIRLSGRVHEMNFIENRYKNAIYYADHLMGRFFEVLKGKGLYEESMIVFTGDHGEEFYEEGHLFHASHLSAMQISPPIYYKLGNNQRYFDLPVKPSMTSHVDIFPTLLDFLGAGDLGLDGQSLFTENRWPYVVVTRYHGARAPFEFCVIDGEKKATFRFLDRRKIFSSTTLEFVSLQGMDDRPLHRQQNDDFSKAFEKLFK